MNYHSEVRNGTLGGTLIALIHTLAGDLLHTALIAATGAFVSFCSTIILKRMAMWVRGRLPTGKEHNRDQQGQRNEEID